MDTPPGIALGNLLDELCPDHDPDHMADLIWQAIARRNLNRSTPERGNTAHELRADIAAVIDKLSNLPPID